MNYQFMKLNDGTNIAYSDIKKQNGKEIMYVQAERWNDAHDKFDHLEFVLPDCTITDGNGFSKEEKEYLVQRVKKFEHLLFDWAREDGEEAKRR